MGKNIFWLWINEHQLSKARTVMFELVSLEHLHAQKRLYSSHWGWSYGDVGFIVNWRDFLRHFYLQQWNIHANLKRCSPEHVWLTAQLVFSGVVLIRNSLYVYFNDSSRKRNMRKRSIYPSVSLFFFFFLPKHKPMQLLVSQRTARLRKRQIAASLSKDYRWGDRSLARKHVAQKADKWNLIQIQTLHCCVSQTDRHAGVDWVFFLFFFLFFISSPAVPGFQTIDIPNIWMLTQHLQNEWHTLWSKWNHLLCHFSYSYCAIEGFQQNNLVCFSNPVDNFRL